MKIISAEFIKSATDPSHYPEDTLPEIAFAGRSNVGKSSLINTLLQRKKLARMSNTPGRTQLINFFLVNDELFFVDLPGYGYAKVPLEIKKKWGPMVERYLKSRKNLRMVILILDIRRDPTKDDLSLVSWLYTYGIKPVFVLTKSDKLSKSRVAVRRRAIGETLEVSDDALVTFSARTREGRETVWNVIVDSITV
ncbi:MAG: YihA family ribosome biogenesis GTP-binding protein [Deltaproteobacteria bacterium]|nr:YihA family ribosome biogenesis GTP-binding protein [Deltaproteobacteria bacterium]MBN2844756.1 YihA family ribosome biogenesis GTP-binding protein [Deltaproteobacteria bacterium]